MSQKVMPQTFALNQGWLSIKINGVLLPVYGLMFILLCIAIWLDKLPMNMLGAFAVLMLIGNILNHLGNHLPIIKSYLGGGAVFSIFVSAALATYQVLPTNVVDLCANFLNDMGFLDLYIATLITGSILGMNRQLLTKASVRFLPVSFISMGLAIVVVGIVGSLIGYGFREAILYISLPMMSGGMGAGVIPLSSIYSDTMGVPASDIVSTLIPASAFGNALAIIAAALIAKTGEFFPKYNGQGVLMPIKEDTAKGSPAKLDFVRMGVGLLTALSFFLVGSIINKFFPDVHAYAFMIIVVVIAKIAGLIPQYYEECATMWSTFVMQNLTAALLAGIGIALLDLTVLANAMTWQFVLLSATSILTVALASAIGGKIVGFFPVESSITAGLCTNSMGGTGNIAVLSASDRMNLIPFAQMATRIGGALILILSSFLVKLL